MNNVKNSKAYNRVSDIIESLVINQNPDSVAVLEKLEQIHLLTMSEK